ncbi:hypothetical protein ACFYZ8_33470 [Streptomyces sp. NPDC001668]|uniref:hypothetical protein n=1 Tax=Streptomyces sp. NPDC001668 TaxID=3364598 RepID=UPI0036CCC3D5
MRQRLAGPEADLLRLVDQATGAEIRPGDEIADPYGQGTIVYLGPTRGYDINQGPSSQAPGRIARVYYYEPETEWAYRPCELGARYEERPPA